MDIESYFKESADVKIEFIKNNSEKLQEVIWAIYDAIKNNHQIFICWNGWSAADAQHVAAEFTGRYKTERQSLPAIALTTDTSALTAIWNDYGFDQVFSRQLEWLGKKWDVLIWISTSWNSENIVKAVEMANRPTKDWYLRGSLGVSGTSKQIRFKNREWINANHSSQSNLQHLPHLTPLGNLVFCKRGS